MNNLTATFEAELLRRTPAADRVRLQAEDSKAEAALTDWYLMHGKRAPAVVWCDSIYQFVLLPSLFIGLVHSDMWHILSNTLVTGEELGAAPQGWDDAWAQLWANGGYQLLRGMKATSLIREHYFHLETGLITQAKNQLGRWLMSGKMPHFQEGLSRDIYRQFWGLHMWHKNFAADRVKFLNCELLQLLNYELANYPGQWEQFRSFHERLLSGYESVCANQRSIIGQMGAEPVNQLRNAIWLPFMFPAAGIAQMWNQHVNPAAFSSYQLEISLWNKIWQSAQAVVALDAVVFVCRQPILHSVDERWRIHNESEAAMKYADGFAVYAWHGVLVDEDVITAPEQITVEKIETMRNIEVRRVLIERYGLTRYLQDSGAKVIHEDDFGTLYRKQIAGDEDLVMVKVVNSTAEPDGTFRDYFLRVPPSISRAKEAVAWTFGLAEEDYSPDFES